MAYVFGVSQLCWKFSKKIFGNVNSFNDVYKTPTTKAAVSVNIRPIFKKEGVNQFVIELP